MDPGPLRDVLVVALGFATGVLSGLFGVGGGVISQPGMRLLGIEPLIAIGTALPAILPGAASGSARYARERLVDWRGAAATIPGGLAAAFAGGLLAESVPGDGHLLQVITAVLLGFSAWRMWQGPRTAEPDDVTDPTDPTAPADPDRTAPVGAGTFVAIGLVAGLLSGLLGIGGGVLMVPAFTHLARLPLKRAIATSLVCVGAFAVPGTIAHALAGHVDWRVAAALVVGIIPGARVGAHLAIAAADRRLRLLVSAFLGLTAVVYGGAELAILLT
jgi:uncharacterized membrane protein YfcA